LVESGDDFGDLKDKFTIKRFDEKFEEVLPRVSRIVKERESFLAKIEESSLNPITVSGKVRSYESVIDFTSPAHAFSFKLGQLAESICDDQPLTEFVSKVSRKIAEGSDLNAFEINVIRNVLENATNEEKACSSKRKKTKPCDIRESVEFERLVNRSVKLFI
jgi:hypothetical protein